MSVNNCVFRVAGLLRNFKLKSCSEKHFSLSPLLLSSREGFSVDNEGYTVVYTDGSCSKNGNMEAKAGIGVWWGEGLQQYNISEPVTGNRQTNNVAEIQAATRAVNQARQLEISKLNIHTDSMFLVKSMTEWIDKWKENNWRTTNKKEVVNKEDIQALDREMLMSEILVKWTHVQRKSGHTGNLAADKLAKLATRMD